MKQTDPRLAALVVLFVLTSSPAFADAGTPYLLTSWFLLLFGNIAIGMVEALLLWLLLGRRNLDRALYHAILILIVGNYLSMGLGILPPPFSERILGPIPLYGVRFHTAWSILWSYLLTLAVELPFVYWAVSLVSTRTITLHKVFGLNLILQTATCSFVILVTLHTMWLPTPEQIDPTLVSRQQPKGWVWYLAPGGRSLERIRLNGAGREVMRSLSESERADILKLEPRDLPGTFEIQGVRWEKDNPGTAFLGPVLKLPFKEASYDLLTLRDTDYRQESEPKCHVMRVASAGIVISEATRTVHVLVDAPHCYWYGYGSGTSIALSGGLFIFQLGPQIALYSLSEDKLGVLTLGSWPIYVPD